MSIRLRDMDPYKSYCRWAAGTADFRCFFRPANFVSLKNYPDFELSEVLPEIDGDALKALKLLETCGTDNTLLILDLPGCVSICAAYLLQTKLKIKPVLIFNSILHPFGLIGDREYISRLLYCGTLLDGGDSEDNFKNHALILDSRRYGNYTDDDLRNFFNNQYELGEDDLPSADMLRELGYNAVLYIHEAAVKEDIDGYLSYIAASGIPVCKKIYKESMDE